MIIVKNRELLIPNNERYIGTTYDNDTENRVFQVPRFSQRGVDLAALTFRLDIQYANEAFDTVLLDKEVGEAFIILIWRITSSTLQVPGTLYIGLRAIDDEATVKWSSFSAAMYAERHLNTPGNYTGDLTEIEQMEQDHVYMKGVVDELKSNIDYAHDAEAWAQGTRSGEAVPSTDKTYHKNSKYYSEQADNYSDLSERYAKGTQDGSAVPSGAGYHDNSMYYKELADQHRKTAERYAKGTENGTAVTSGVGYQDNAKYYKEQVQASANQISTNATNIAAQTSRVDSLISTYGGYSNGTLIQETVLWQAASSSEYLGSQGDTATLASALSGFDYIDYYLLSNGQRQIHRFLSSVTSPQFTVTNQPDSDSSANFLNFREVGLSISGTTATVGHSTDQLMTSGSSSITREFYTQSNPTSGEGIYKIVGVKHTAAGSSQDAEVTDIRIGADGTTYATAGDAVRGQVGDLKSQLDAIGEGINYTPVALRINCSIDTYGSEKVILPSSIKTENGWVCACVSCNPGDVFTVSGIGGYTTRFWAFANSSGTLLDGSASGAHGKDVKTIPAPEGAAYFAYNSRMNHANWPYNAYKGEVPTKVFETIQTEVNDINKNLQSTGLVNSVSFESSDNGHYIRNSGAYEASAPFSITAPFLLKKGYTLSAYVCGYASAVAVIASYNEDSNTYTPLVVDDGGTDSKEYTYTADSDKMIVISYSRNKAFRANIVLKMYEFVNSSQKNAFGYGCLFPRLAVCGDSLSSGVLVESSGNEVHVYGDSWLSFLARRINATARNHYSEGGMTCKSWLSKYLTKMQTDEASNAYFVALGTNDAYFYDIGLAGSYPIGNISDEAGTDTFVGYYKQIINALRTKAPNAVIFCVSNYNSNALAHQYSEMISAISDLYDNCFYVDFINNTDVYTSTGGVWSNIAHFTTIGYAYVSNVIYDLVNHIVEENKEFFKWFGKNNSSGGQYED